MPHRPTGRTIPAATACSSSGLIVPPDYWRRSRFESGRYDQKGVRITSEIDPKRRGILESRFDELQLWDCINETLKWSRLYGGAVALILIEGQAPLTPLVLDKVGKGSFKGLAVLDRWMINPQLTGRIKALGPNLGKPEFYEIVTTAQGFLLGLFTTAA